MLQLFTADLICNNLDVVAIVPVSYLIQVKVLHRRDLGAGPHHTHQGGQHPQQRVPHGFFFVFCPSAATSEVSTRGEERRGSGGSFYARGPAPRRLLLFPSPPPRPTASFWITKTMQITAVTQPARVRGRGGGEVRGEERGEWVNNKVLLTAPPFSLLHHKCSACLY